MVLAPSRTVNKVTDYVSGREFGVEHKRNGDRNQQVARRIHRPPVHVVDEKTGILSTSKFSPFTTVPTSQCPFVFVEAPNFATSSLN